MPVRAEKLVLVEHLRQHATEPRFVENRRQTPARDAQFQRIVNGRAQLGPRFQEPMEPLGEFGTLRQQFPFEHGRRAQRKQADHRPNLQTLGSTIGQAQHVVIEAVLLVPHSRVLPQVPHRRSNPQEVLGEFQRHILVVGIGQRQLGGDFQHVLAEQRHPGGAVGLLQISAGRQRRAAIEHADVVEPQKAPLKNVSS